MPLSSDERTTLPLLAQRTRKTKTSPATNSPSTSRIQIRFLQHAPECCSPLCASTPSFLLCTRLLAPMPEWPPVRTAASTSLLGPPTPIPSIASLRPVQVSAHPLNIHLRRRSAFLIHRLQPEPSQSPIIPFECGALHRGPFFDLPAAAAATTGSVFGVDDAPGVCGAPCTASVCYVYSAHGLCRKALISVWRGTRKECF